MAVLQLHNQMNSDALILPGRFIDTYLPVARGDDIRIFLYFLRAVSRPDTEVSLASVSDILDLSEKELLRSLTYWEKTGLLQLSFNSDHILEAISFQDMDRAAASRESAAASGREPKKKAAAETAPREKQVPLPRDLTPAELSALDQDMDFNGLIFMAEQSFGSPLKRTDIDRLGYWYVNFNRSLEIMESLLEYCVLCQSGHPNIRYLDTVAAGWFSEGITTAEQAREYSQTRNSLVYGVMKAFGIKSRRDPNPVEQEMVLKWSREYGFSQEMIVKACTRTAARTSQDQFAYADRILSSWHKNGVRTPADVEAADASHRKRAAASSRQSVEISKSARQFHNFEERTTDYESLVMQQYRDPDAKDPDSLT